MRCQQMCSKMQQANKITHYRPKSIQLDNCYRAIVLLPGNENPGAGKKDDKYTYRVKIRAHTQRPTVLRFVDEWSLGEKTNEKNRLTNGWGKKVNSIFFYFFFVRVTFLLTSVMVISREIQ